MRLLRASMFAGIVCVAGLNPGPLSLTAAAGGFRQTVRATDLGVWLVAQQDGLTVARTTDPLANLGLRSGDQIVAVNGRRVATERAFVGRVVAAINSGATADILVARQGTAVLIGASGSGQAATTSPAAPHQASQSAPAGAAHNGFLNPDNMVITKDGRIMHKAAAARLGVEVLKSFEGTTAPPGAVN